MVFDWIMSKKMIEEWYRQPPENAYEGLPFPCTPDMFSMFQAFPLVSKSSVTPVDMEGVEATWGSIFPSSILFRFLIGLANKDRPVMPAAEPENGLQRIFLIKTLFLTSEWRDADRKMMREWIFGDLFTEALHRPSSSPLEDKKRHEEVEGMRKIVDMFYGIHQGLTAVSYPVEMGLVNHNALIEPDIVYRYSKGVVIDALNMMTPKQAYSWTTEV